MSGPESDLEHFILVCNFILVLSQFKVIDVFETQTQQGGGGTRGGFLAAISSSGA